MASGEEIEERIIVVANRLPVTITKKKGKFSFQQSPGGLATALSTLQSKKKIVFFGWAGYIPENSEEMDYLRKKLNTDYNCHPIFLNQKELDKFYYGFSNKTLWPLFHYFSSNCTFKEEEWKTYKNVNQKFFKEIIKNVTEQDLIWIHDYHLMLLPDLLRNHMNNCSIGFFLHIPFPSFELFRILPWSTEILEGLLGSDLIGFHTYEYVRHFLSSVLRVLGYEHELGIISCCERMIKVDNFPIGIDFKFINDLLKKSSTNKEIDKIKRNIGTKQKKVILSVDRLDYTKGIPQRLDAFELFLTRNPEWHNKIVYVMLCVPSRTEVDDYFSLKQEVEGLIGKINGRFGTPEWIPVIYMFRSLPFKKLLPLYAISDVALVTPVRDGMNLVAKEYVASRKNNSGVLILSETAGAAFELGEALFVNIYNKEEVVEALNKALSMSEEEQQKRITAMKKRIENFDIYHWTENFINGVKDIKKLQIERQLKKLNKEQENIILSDLRKSKKRLLLFDYDGTLISFSKTPMEAKPDDELKSLLMNIANNPNNKLIIISGRDRQTMETWLGDIPCSLVAEHGARIRSDPVSNWSISKPIHIEWREHIKAIFKIYEARVPGSFVEEKEYSLVWHYRKASDPELGEIRACELFDNLTEYLANTELQLTYGKKIIEVKPIGINKGEATDHFLIQREWDFILAVGDDWTDEDIFKVLPPFAYSIKIGYGTTLAKFIIESTQTCRLLLQQIARIK